MSTSLGGASRLAISFGSNQTNHSRQISLFSAAVNRKVCAISKRVISTGQSSPFPRFRRRGSRSDVPPPVPRLPVRQISRSNRRILPRRTSSHLRRSRNSRDSFDLNNPTTRSIPSKRHCPCPRPAWGRRKISPLALTRSCCAAHSCETPRGCTGLSFLRATRPS